MTSLWIALALVAAALWEPFLQPETRAGRKGLSAYEKGDYIEALTRFQEAAEASEDPAAYEYNSGLAAQEAGNPQAAVGYYLKARDGERLVPGAADYNRGTALADWGKPEDALQAFRAALRANPEDEDARYNYEVLLKQAQEDSSQSGEQDSDSQDSPQNQDQQGEQDQSQNQDSSQDGEQQESDQQQQQQQEQQTQQGDADPQGDQQGASPQAEREQAMPLDRQQAERLLNALMQGERDLLKSRLKGDRRRRAEKDW